MTEPSGSVWLAADGEHVQFAHVCNGEPKVDTLPNSIWPVPADGDVKPSIHCQGCGFHEFLTLRPRPSLMDAIDGDAGGVAFSRMGPTRRPRRAEPMTAPLPSDNEGGAPRTEAGRKLLGWLRVIAAGELPPPIATAEPAILAIEAEAQATDPAGLEEALRLVDEVIFDLPIGNDVTYSRGYSAGVAAARESLRDAILARLSVADGPLLEDSSPLGHGTPVPEEATLPSGDARVAGL